MHHLRRHGVNSAEECLTQVVLDNQYLILSFSKLAVELKTFYTSLGSSTESSSSEGPQWYQGSQHMVLGWVSPATHVPRRGFVDATPDQFQIF